MEPLTEDEIKQQNIDFLVSEYRRVKALNAELVEALKIAVPVLLYTSKIEAIVRAAIAKAEQK